MSDSRTGRRRLSKTRYVLYIAFICLSVVLMYLSWGCGMAFFMVPSRSMEPTLMPGDHLITFHAKTYRRGDIVVFKDPEDSSGYLVKRIVAVPGDSVSILGGALMLNGKYVSEPYIVEPMAVDLDTPIEVGQGEAFVLGDNRNLSEDSSVWRKAVPENTIIGRVYAVYLPFGRIGRVRHFPLVNSDGE